MAAIMIEEFERECEPLLKSDPRLYGIFPIIHHDIWEKYKQAQSVFWIAEEIDLCQDLSDYNSKLNDNERHFINMVLAFFSNADGIVNENIGQNMIARISIPEAKYFYNFQEMMENIHAETYGLLIDTYIRDEAIKNHLFNAIQTIPSVQRKANWMFQYSQHGENYSFAELLVVFACVEGIFFSGSFCAIFWLKKRGLMPGLCFSNELISRDEGLHQEFACLLYSKLEHTKLTREKIIEIITTAVSIEKMFITEALPVELIGMNSMLMSQYIEFVADKLLIMLGYNPYFRVLNPFEWMETISLQGKTNFFEKRVSEYRKYDSQPIFTTTEEF